jgi:hypothetical protein
MEFLTSDEMVESFPFFFFLEDCSLFGDSGIMLQIVNHVSTKEIRTVEVLESAE